MRAVIADIRTLFISSYIADIIAPHGVLDDGVEFLEKPFTRNELLRRVRETLDRAAPVDANLDRNKQQHAQTQ